MQVGRCTYNAGVSLNVCGKIMQSILTTQSMTFQRTKKEEDPSLLLNYRNSISNLHSTSRASQLFYKPRCL